jgi:hypothetical protein
MRTDLTPSRVFVDNIPLHGTLSIEDDAQTAQTDAPSPDPRWTFVDSAGHFHARDSKGGLPTLVSKPEHVDCDGSCGGVCGGEGYTVVRCCCVICGEEVVPGTVPGPREVVVNRRRSWKVSVVNAPMSMADRVSVRFEVSGSPPMFGVARVCDGTFQSGEMDVELRGEGPLSTMSCPVRLPVEDSG